MYGGPCGEYMYEGLARALLGPCAASDRERAVVVESGSEPTREPRSAHVTARQGPNRPKPDTGRRRPDQTTRAGGSRGQTANGTPDTEAPTKKSEKGRGSGERQRRRRRPGRRRGGEGRRRGDGGHRLLQRRIPGPCGASSPAWPVFPWFPTAVG